MESSYYSCNIIIWQVKHGHGNRPEGYSGLVIMSATTWVYGKSAHLVKYQTIFEANVPRAGFIPSCDGKILWAHSEWNITGNSLIGRCP
jgi:hypothetical protein